MGRPKAWLDLDGTPLLTHIAAQVAEVCQPLAIVAASGQKLPELPQAAQLLEDRHRGEGPLIGVETGLALMFERVPYAYVTATDMPLLTVSLIRGLTSRARSDAIVCASAGDRGQPLCAVYPRRVLSTLQDLIRKGERRLMSLLDSFPCEVEDVVALGEDARSVTNVNTPGDWERALAAYRNRE